MTAKPSFVIPTGVMQSITQWRNPAYVRQRLMDLISSQVYSIRMSSGNIYYVYIMANQSRTLYVGFTNNIRQRVRQHKDGLVEGFTSRYKIDTLVYFETFSDVLSGIAREKQIKRWRELLSK